MPFEMQESFEIIGKMADSMAYAISLENPQGRKHVEEAMQAGATIILDQMKKNAEKHIKSGKTYNAIKIMKPKSMTGSMKIKIGIDKIEGSDFFYPAAVEFGHGGPHKAPPHPFIRPAFDQKAEEAYSKIRQGLMAALDEQTK